MDTSGVPQMLYDGLQYIIPLTAHWVAVLLPLVFAVAKWLIVIDLALRFLVRNILGQEYVQQPNPSGAPDWWE